MQIVKASNLACPLCGAPFGPWSKHLLCPNGHSFDAARQGYVHLLPVQNKRSREPGDSQAMVEARSRFLDAGLYSAISERLNATALAHLSEEKSICIVDAGCGEGYYLDRLAQALAADGRIAEAALIGLDIAKPAVLAACRRNKALTWLVASNTNPAIAPGTVDVVLCMFGFPTYDSFARILKPGGKVILVDAGPDHLLELRQVIYPEVRRAPPPSLEKAQQAGFELIDSQTLSYQTEELNPVQIADLLMMTPHLYRATREGKEAAARLERLVLTVDVVFRVLQRT